MQAILIKYLPATDTRGARLKAVARSGSITQPRKYELECDDQARALAERFAKTYWDRSVKGFGTLENGDYVATIGE